MSQTKEKFFISDIESKAANALQCVSLLPGSWDKKFIRSLNHESLITVKQQEWLRRLFYKYRRQIKNYLEIDMELNPDNYRVTISETLFGIEIKIE